MVFPTGAARMLGEIAISSSFNPRRQASDIYVNGECVEEKNAVSRSVRPSVRSAHSGSAPKLVALQQRMGKDKGVVMDGATSVEWSFPMRS